MPAQKVPVYDDYGNVIGIRQGRTIAYYNGNAGTRNTPFSNLYISQYGYNIYYDDNGGVSSVPGYNPVTGQHYHKAAHVYSVEQAFALGKAVTFTNIARQRREYAQWIGNEQMANKWIKIEQDNARLQQQILNHKTNNAADFRKLGRQVEGYDDQIWNRVATSWMGSAMMAKATADPYVHDALVKTAGCDLVEAAPRDSKWGAGVDIDRTEDLTQYSGSNIQGVLLKSIRKQVVGDEIYRQQTIARINQRMDQVMNTGYGPNPNSNSVEPDMGPNNNMSNNNPVPNNQVNNQPQNNQPQQTQPQATEAPRPSRSDLRKKPKTLSDFADEFGNFLKELSAQNLDFRDVLSKIANRVKGNDQPQQSAQKTADIQTDRHDGPDPDGPNDDNHNNPPAAGGQAVAPAPQSTPQPQGNQKPGFGPSVANGNSQNNTQSSQPAPSVDDMPFSADDNVNTQTSQPSNSKPGFGQPSTQQTQAPKKRPQQNIDPSLPSDNDVPPLPDESEMPPENDSQSISNSQQGQPSNLQQGQNGRPGFGQPTSQQTQAGQPAPNQNNRPQTVQGQPRPAADPNLEEPPAEPEEDNASPTPGQEQQPAGNQQRPSNGRPGFGSSQNNRPQNNQPSQDQSRPAADPNLEEPPAETDMGNIPPMPDQGQQPMGPQQGAQPGNNRQPQGKVPNGQGNGQQNRHTHMKVKRDVHPSVNHPSDTYTMTAFGHSPRDVYTTLSSSDIEMMSTKVQQEYNQIHSDSITIEQAKQKLREMPADQRNQFLPKAEQMGQMAGYSRQYAGEDTKDRFAVAEQLNFEKMIQKRLDQYGHVELQCSFGAGTPMAFTRAALAVKERHPRAVKVVGNFAGPQEFASRNAKVKPDDRGMTPLDKMSIEAKLLLNQMDGVNFYNYKTDEKGRAKEIKSTYIDRNTLRENYLHGNPSKYDQAVAKAKAANTNYQLPAGVYWKMAHDQIDRSHEMIALYDGLYEKHNMYNERRVTKQFKKPVLSNTGKLIRYAEVNPQDYNYKDSEPQYDDTGNLSSAREIVKSDGTPMKAKGYKDANGKNVPGETLTHLKITQVLPYDIAGFVQEVENDPNKPRGLYDVNEIDGIPVKVNLKTDTIPGKDSNKEAGHYRNAVLNNFRRPWQPDSNYRPNNGYNSQSNKASYSQSQTVNNGNRQVPGFNSGNNRGSLSASNSVVRPGSNLQPNSQSTSQSIEQRPRTTSQSSINSQQGFTNSQNYNSQSVANNQQPRYNSAPQQPSNGQQLGFSSNGGQQPQTGQPGYNAAPNNNPQPGFNQSNNSQPNYSVPQQPNNSQQVGFNSGYGQQQNGMNQPANNGQPGYNAAPNNNQQSGFNQSNPQSGYGSAPQNNQQPTNNQNSYMAAGQNNPQSAPLANDEMQFMNNAGSSMPTNSQSGQMPGFESFDGNTAGSQTLNESGVIEPTSEPGDPQVEQALEYMKENGNVTSPQERANLRRQSQQQKQRNFAQNNTENQQSASQQNTPQQGHQAPDANMTFEVF